MKREPLTTHTSVQPGIVSCTNCGWRKRLPDVVVITRTYEDGKKSVKAIEERSCPECYHHLHAVGIQAEVSPKVKCGAMCWGARSKFCRCSCGGTAHGVNL